MQFLCNLKMGSDDYWGLVNKDKNFIFLTLRTLERECNI